MITRLFALGLFTMLSFSFAWHIEAASVVWLGSRAEAVQAARNSGKLILLLAGRDTCGNCQYMKNTVCETAGIREFINTNYVCWYCLVDNSTEWYSYASGLGSFYLPLLCVIDPGNPTTYLDRSTNIQEPAVFTPRLKSHVPTNAIIPTLAFTSTARVRWASQRQLQYRVLRSDDLVSWSFVAGPFAGTGAPLEFQDSSVATRRFYRVMGFK